MLAVGPRIGCSTQRPLLAREVKEGEKCLLPKVAAQVCGASKNGFIDHCAWSVATICRSSSCAYAQPCQGNARAAPKPRQGNAGAMAYLKGSPTYHMNGLALGMSHSLDALQSQSLHYGGGNYLPI